MNKQKIKRIVENAIAQSIKGQVNDISEQQVDEILEWDLSLAEIMRGSSTNNVNQSLDTLVTNFKKWGDDDLNEAAAILQKVIGDINNARNKIGSFMQRNGI